MFLAADQWNDAFFVSVNPLHARHVREKLQTMPPTIRKTHDQRSLGEAIPGHALHEKGLQRQIGVVRNEERSLSIGVAALVVSWPGLACVY